MKLKNIVIDRGNTFIKAALFEGDTLLEEETFLKTKQIVKYIHDQNVKHLIISSVAGKTRKLLNKLNDDIVTFRLGHTTLLPFHNHYETPETLGSDRVAGIAGARKLFPDKNVLVIDTGTCVKYDFIDAEGNYYGGGISPGLEMRFKALNKFTSKLPLVRFSSSSLLVGKSTEESIRSGVVNGTIAEIEGIIDKYKEKYDELTVLICGGDSKFFESKLKGHIFAVANLVLIGLNHILLQNINHFEVKN